MLKKFPRIHLIVLGLATTTVGALTATGSSQEAEANRISIDVTQNIVNGSAADTIATSQLAEDGTTTLAFNGANQSNVSANLPSEAALLEEQTGSTEPQETEALTTITYNVKNGDTLSSIFSRAGYDDKLIYKIFSGDKQNKQLANIHPGQQLSFEIQDTRVPLQIKLQLNKLESIVATADDNGDYRYSKEVIEPEVRTSYAAGQIDSSLFLAAKSAGLDEAVIMGLANIFGWDVDFSLDIRSGDKFNMVYEELYLNDEKIGNGKILAANFTNQDHTYQAVLYTDSDGRSSYFTPSGQSMRKEFLRSPVEFARISSHFNLKRKHPVLHKIRAHKGTDYAASTGTPIRATGDGTVIHAGRKGGYGKAVIIKHGQQFTTLYAHMSKYGRGIHNGSKVNQGQIIGYVGSTGLASGPHLHYEFRVNGVHKNPLTVSLPQADHIPKSEMEQFRTATAPALNQLETYESTYQVALHR